MPRPKILALRPAVSQFLTVLSDLVNFGEYGLAALQVAIARVDVGLLRERRVVVTGSLLLMMEIGTPACSMSVRGVWRESCRVIRRSPARLCDQRSHYLAVEGQCSLAATGPWLLDATRYSTRTRT